MRRRARVFVLSAAAFSACVMKPRLTMIEQQVRRRSRVLVLSATAFSACVMKPRRLTMIELQDRRLLIIKECRQSINIVEDALRLKRCILPQASPKPPHYPRK
jgi:hypothetical protein